jgi:hypothetical protein
MDSRLRGNDWVALGYKRLLGKVDRAQRIHQTPERHWIPAFAGTTTTVLRASAFHPTAKWIPTCVGMTGWPWATRGYLVRCVRRMLPGGAPSLARGMACLEMQYSYGSPGIYRKILRRHSREGGNPFGLSIRTHTMDSRLRGNDRPASGRRSQKYCFVDD